MLKSSDSCLVSNKNFSKKLLSSDLGPGPGSLNQNGQKYPHYDVIHKKNKKTKFICALLTQRLAASLEGLYSSLTHSPGELCS